MARSFSRREFVNGGLGLVGLGFAAPYFLTRTARALQEKEDIGSPRARDGRVLVVLQLAGGNDGLNTVIPLRDDLYYKLRPQIAIASEKALGLGDDFGLHPSATGLKKLYDDGLLSIVLGVGYPNPNRSHFVSTDIWETADPGQRAYTGWLGRYFDSCCGERDPKLAMALTEESPLALRGRDFSPVCFESPEQLQWRPHRSSPGAERVFEALNPPPSSGSGEGKPLSALDYLRKVSLDARQSAQKIREAAGTSRPMGKSRGKQKLSLEEQLGMVVRMILAELPTKVYFVSLGGFDTHSNQTGRHQALMKQLGDALGSFATSLKEHKIEDRVLLMTFSEFGRRVAQNASGGTDHGTASPLFLVGASVKAGLQGKQPGLQDLDSGDLRFTTDFRSVYAGVIEDWLAADPAPVLGTEISKLSLLRG